MSIRLLFAWYDLWIGAFWDRKARKLYVLPLPCIGIVVSFGPQDHLGRDAKDFAIEFAEYMAKDAERLRRSIRQDDPEVCELSTAVRSSIYEFRKRAAKAGAVHSSGKDVTGG